MNFNYLENDLNDGLKKMIYSINIQLKLTDAISFS